MNNDNPKTASIPVERCYDGNPSVMEIRGPQTEAKRAAGIITIMVGAGFVYRVEVAELLKAVAFAIDPPGDGGLKHVPLTPEMREDPNV